MSSPPLFAMLDKYWKDNTKTLLMDGIVQNIRGVTASVFLSGSGQSVDAWFGKGTDIVTGDRVLLVRAERSNKWVIVAAYGTEKTGHSTFTPPTPIEETATSTVIGFSRLGGQAQRTSLTATTRIASVSFLTSKEGIIQTGISAFVKATAYSANAVDIMTKVNDTEIGSSRTYFPTSSEAQQQMNTILPAQVGAGRQTITWDILPNGTTLTVEVRNAWGYEV